MNPINNRPVLNPVALNGSLHGVLPYRGLGVNVQGMTTDAAVHASGLGWKAIGMPVLVQGRTENRRAEDFKAIVRSDNGKVLDITSQAFKIHQNNDTVGLFLGMCDAGDMELLVLGELDSGREVFGVAKAKGQFAMKLTDHQRTFNAHAGGTAGVADVTELHFILRSGHKPGTPTSLRAYATRLWCYNGVRFTERAEAQFRLTHRSELTTEHKKRIKAVVDAAVMEFATYEERCRRMLGTPMTREESELVVMELLQPELAGVARNRAAAADVIADGAAVIDSIIAMTELLQANAVTQEIRDQQNRGVRYVVENLDAHPGAVPGTVWNTFNAVTHYVDHVRGRNADSGLRAAMFGDGDRIKSSALDALVEFTMARQGAMA